jgi:hypothetical protein
MMCRGFCPSHSMSLSPEALVRRARAFIGMLSQVQKATVKKRWTSVGKGSL